MSLIVSIIYLLAMLTLVAAFFALGARALNNYIFWDTHTILLVVSSVIFISTRLLVHYEVFGILGHAMGSLLSFLVSAVSVGYHMFDEWDNENFGRGTTNLLVEAKRESKKPKNRKKLISQPSNEMPMINAEGSVTKYDPLGILEDDL